MQDITLMIQNVHYYNVLNVQFVFVFLSFLC